MSKAITGLVFLALVFGAYSTTSTIISGVESTPFDTTANADTDGTYSFSATYSAVGPGSAAATQYIYGVTVASSLPSTIDTKSLTVTTSDNTVAAGTYASNQGTFSLSGTAIDDSAVLAANDYYVLFAYETVSSVPTVYAYWWKGSDTTATAPTEVSLYAGTDATTPLLLGNAWYADGTFWIVVIMQSFVDPDYTDTGFGVYGFDTATEAAAAGTYTYTLATAVTSSATGAINAMGGCNTATDCGTINVIYTNADASAFYVIPIVSGTAGADADVETLTLPTDDADGTTSTYAVAGTVGLSTTPLHLLSRAANDGTTTTYTLVAYQGTTATNAYYITPGSTATGAITVYWSGIANGNTEPSIITTYSTSSGTTYDYVYTTVDATAVGKSYTFGTFDYAPSIYVDATPQLWCAWFTGSAPITAVNVAPLGSSILMSAIAFVSMIVMTLFMF